MALGLLWAVPLATCAEQGAGDPGAPNILIILVDDLGAGEFGCYGNTRQKTPAIDALARQGLQFNTFWVTPKCAPTRVGLLTGRYGFRTGWYSNSSSRPGEGAPHPRSPQYRIDRSEVTFAEVLKTRGYATAVAGKWHAPMPDEPKRYSAVMRDCGFDEHCLWARMTLSESGKLTGPRSPKHYGATIVRNGRILPQTDRDFADDTYTDFVIDFMERHRRRPFLVYFPTGLIHAPLVGMPDEPSADEQSMGTLKANVEYLDKLVGRLVKGLEEQGLRRRTLVFLLGDNGTSKAALKTVPGLKGVKRASGKGRACELGVRVPLIVNGPGILERLGVTDELADLSDLLPTLAELAGIEDLPGLLSDMAREDPDLSEDRTIDGRSLAPFLLGRSEETRPWIFSYLLEQRMLRDRRWLLEGDGRFFDCGDNRDGRDYEDVTESTDPEVVLARQRFERILQDLPAPTLQPRRPFKPAWAGER
jgi:arylsulfatase A-like enzyme